MIQKIYDYFGLDGLIHIICSNLIVSILCLFLPLWISVVVAAIIGIGKEVIWDKILGKGSFDKKDLLADFIGVIIGCL